MNTLCHRIQKKQRMRFFGPHPPHPQFTSVSFSKILSNNKVFTEMIESLKFVMGREGMGRYIAKIFYTSLITIVFNIYSLNH